jgi:glutamate dehydrogenase
VQIEMMLGARRMLERATRWLLRTRPRPLDIAAEVGRFGEGAAVIAGALPGLLVESEQDAWRERVAALAEQGVPEEVAGRAASHGALFSALDIVSVADAAGRDVAEVAALHFLIGGRLHLHWLRDQIALLARDTRWATMARAALRDDLFSLHADLTADVLRHPSLDEWYEDNRAAVVRAQEILGEIRAGGTFDLTTLPVALREVRNLIAIRT